MALGYSFAPTTDNADLGRRGGSPPFKQQDPIRTLHFELPRVTGAQSANAISPLVGSERAGSSIGQAVLQSVLRTVLGADAASALLAGSPAATMQGAPIDGGPRVSGGVTGGVTPRPTEPTAIPSFGTPGPTTIHVGKTPGEFGDEDGGRGAGTYAGGLDTEARLNNRSPLYDTKFGDDQDPARTARPSAPDFGGADSFAGGMQREGQLNGRSPLFFDKFANF